MSHSVTTGSFKTSQARKKKVELFWRQVHSIGQAINRSFGLDQKDKDISSIRTFLSYHTGRTVGYKTMEGPWMTRFLFNRFFLSVHVQNWDTVSPASLVIRNIDNKCLENFRHYLILTRGQSSGLICELFKYGLVVYLWNHMLIRRIQWMEYYYYNLRLYRM